MKAHWGFAVLVLAALPLGAWEKRFEAEEVLLNKEALTATPDAPRKWLYWTDDPKSWRWTGGKVLRSPGPQKKSAPGQDSEVLKFAIPVPEDGNYDLQVRYIWRLAASLDEGKNWRELNKTGDLLINRPLKKGDTVSVWLSAHLFSKVVNRVHLDHFTLCKREAIPSRPVQGYASSRVEERLDRGVAALETKPGGPVYVSWRLLKEDPPDAAFDLFAVADGRESKCNALPIRQTTDFLVAKPVPGAVYTVRPAGGKLGVSGSAAVQKADPMQPGFSYRFFALNDPHDTPQRVAVADLDGDGAYDYVVLHGENGLHVDPWCVAWVPSRGTFKVSAFRSDGTRLWTRDLGWNIENGIWYTALLAADLDGDGKAEVAVKTSDTDRDYRTKEGPQKGEVTTGPEYLSIWEGMTGKELARAPWPSREAFGSDYNNCSRNLITLGYLDGKTPCVIPIRGTYGLILAEAWTFHGGKLTPHWKFSTADCGARYRGEGAHTAFCLDLDDDGKDEVVLGGAVIDHDGRPLWSMGKGHPDRIIVTHVMGKRTGLQFVAQYESTCREGGVLCADAGTGKILWQLKKLTSHFHHGYFGDMDAMARGWTTVALDNVSGGHSGGRYPWIFAPDGTILAEGKSVPEVETRFTAYWDADLQKELTLVNDVQDFLGKPVGGGYRGKYLFAADLYGDWREEILAAVPGGFRIYSTLIPAYDRRVSLMQDPHYRGAIYGSAMGYFGYPTLSYLPVNEAVGFSLRIDPRKPDELIVVVSSLLTRSAAGTVTITSEDGELQENRWQVLLAPGSEKERRFVLPAGGKGRVTGVLRLESGEERKVVLPRFVDPSAGRTADLSFLKGKTFVLEAEGGHFSGGRLVRNRAFFAGLSGQSGWRPGGKQPSVSWEFTVPESGAGEYRFGIRYGSRSYAWVRLELDGKAVAEFELPDTGGPGTDVSQLRYFELSAPALQLAPGIRTLRMVLPERKSSRLELLDCVTLERLPARK